MKALIVSPAGPREQLGNAVTANRWARCLEALGLDVEIARELGDHDVDLLVALHARRSASSVARYSDRFLGRPIILALTGTDLYRDLPADVEAARSLELATRLVVLQEAAVESLPEHLRDRARVVHQSVDVSMVGDPVPPDGFQVCVLGHLRPVKDPLLAARAARLVPDDSKLRVVHLGRALSTAMEDAARAETAANPRYEWRGELPRETALSILAGSMLHCLTSHLEGGANAVGEATVLGVPTISTQIPGSIGLLGCDYPGYFPVGDAEALAALLDRSERGTAFRDSLKAATDARAHLFAPARELAAWRDLLTELSIPTAPNLDDG
ncbi:MAG: selenoneine biosynthesis selenosugar synthase SenB [Planctomycetota bacterium]